MNNELKMQISDITQKIIENKVQMERNILEIGNLLIEAKKQLPHGEWSKWLEEAVDFCQSTANRFMKCAKEFSNSESVHNLGSNKIFKLLSIPKDERDEFINVTHKINGKEKTVYDMSTRELQDVIKAKKQSSKTPNVSVDEIIIDDEQRLEQVILERQELEEQLKSKQQQAKEIKEKILMNKKALNLEVEFVEVLEDSIIGGKTLYYDIYLVSNLEVKEIVLEKVLYSYFEDIDINKSFDCIISPIRRNINLLEEEKDFVIGQCLNFKDTAIKREEEISSQYKSFYDDLQDKINKEKSRRKVQNDNIQTVITDENKPTLKKFYKTLAQSFHPDKGGSHEEMQLVNLLKESWRV